MRSILGKPTQSRQRAIDTLNDTITVDPGDPTTLITYRPAGAAVLAVGTGLVATWLLTLLAARRAAKIAQRRHLGLRPAPRLALAPLDPPVP